MWPWLRPFLCSCVLLRLTTWDSAYSLWHFSKLIGASLSLHRFFSLSSFTISLLPRLNSSSLMYSEVVDINFEMGLSWRPPNLLNKYALHFEYSQFSFQDFKLSFCQIHRVRSDAWRGCRRETCRFPLYSVPFATKRKVGVLVHWR